MQNYRNRNLRGVQMRRNYTASLPIPQATKPMTRRLKGSETPIYRFRVLRQWYAYALPADAQAARSYFLENGYPASVVGAIEESSGADFQFKI